MGIAFEAAFGVIELALSSVAKGAAAITSAFGLDDLAAKFEQAAEEMSASADKHFGKAQEKALAFESKTAEAVAHAAETEAQRFARLEAEARTAYQAAAQSAIDAAARAVQAQQAAQAAVGTAQEAAAAKAAQEAEKASSAAKREAQKTEEAWVKAFEKTGGRPSPCSGRFTANAPSRKNRPKRRGRKTRRPALPPPSRPRRRKSASRCPTCNA